MHNPFDPGHFLCRYCQRAEPEQGGENFKTHLPLQPAGVILPQALVHKSFEPHVTLNTSEAIQPCPGGERIEAHLAPEPSAPIELYMLKSSVKTVCATALKVTSNLHLIRPAAATCKSNWRVQVKLC